MRLRSSRDPIVACYEAELARDSSLAGTLRVLFTVQRDGSVVDVVAQENELSPGVASCVVAIIDALHFSPGPRCGPATFLFPFIFAPGD